MGSVASAYLAGLASTAKLPYVGPSASTEIVYTLIYASAELAGKVKSAMSVFVRSASSASARHQKHVNASMGTRAMAAIYRSAILHA